MTKNYTKPIVTIDSGMAEGVYAASGCYTASAYIHQTPENGRGDYRIQVNGKHNADHTKEAQVLTISFNQNVTYVSGGAGLISGNETTTLKVKLAYHQNPTDKHNNPPAGKYNLSHYPLIILVVKRNLHFLLNLSH